MKAELFQLNAQCIEIAEDKSNDIYMICKLGMLDTLTNANGLQYSAEFIQDIVDNKSEYIGIPLVADINQLIKGNYDKLTHLQDKKTGQLKTAMIGSFVDFEVIKGNNQSVRLVGTAKIFKRFPAVCDAIAEIYNSGDLKFSYEILVSEYKVSDGIKFVDKAEHNKLMAMCVVTVPAVKSAQAELLVAEIIGELNSEVQNMERTPDTFTCETMFANTILRIEQADLDISQIRQKIYNAFKSLEPNEYYNYDVVDMTLTYVIMKDYADGDLYKIEYTVSDNDVTLSNKRKVTKTYQDIPDKEDENQMTAEVLKAEVEKAEAKIKELEAMIAEKETALQAKESELAEANAKIVTMGETLESKETEIAELTPYKEQIEKAEAEKAEAEKTAKKEALKSKCEKILSAEEMVVVAEAIESLDEATINKVLADKYIAKAEAEASKAKEVKTEKTYVTASRVTDEIKVGGNDVVSRYITIEN